LEALGGRGQGHSGEGTWDTEGGMTQKQLVGLTSALKHELAIFRLTPSLHSATVSTIGDQQLQVA